MRIFFLLQIIVFFPTSGLWAESILVNTNILNVRHQPEGQKIGRVYRGEQFMVLEEQKGWGKIQFQYNQHGWVSLQYTTPLSQHSTIYLQSFCQKLNEEFDQLKWKSIRCRNEDWQANMRSVKGHPLIYTVVGKQSPATLLLCSVHSDENTPYQCFRLLQLLQQQPELLNHSVVIAPLVNPDGFFKRYKTRTNARKVDLNRNLPTKDWRSNALRSWNTHYSSNARRYPGNSANSEPENQFVVELIHRFNPDKVISIHAPMNFLDLDYLDPSKSDQTQRAVLKKAQALAVRVSKESSYKFLNYQTFVGSLGRYGKEWKIPIYTLELPSADYTKSESYFQTLKQSMFSAFNFIIDHRRTAHITPPKKGAVN
ncbi:MAG: SH3 domain-containing protein [SAR324 cluster bacterium]|nr:SH3 domain-containing protein [SAR324 cluster bacterium]